MAEKLLISYGDVTREVTEAEMKQINQRLRQAARERPPQLPNQQVVLPMLFLSRAPLSRGPVVPPNEALRIAVVAARFKLAPKKVQDICDRHGGENARARAEVLGALAQLPDYNVKFCAQFATADPRPLLKACQVALANIKAGATSAESKSSNG